MSKWDYLPILVGVEPDDYSFEMLTDGLLAIDPGHHIEVLFVDRIAQLLQSWAVEENGSVEVLASQANTNPFYHL